ncbi:MAG TPA: IPTL-CTERM sorting domain-containing protein [Thermoanaerobaculia bacterium]
MKNFRRLLFVLLLVPMAAFAQSADQEVVSVVDSPDPVTPGSTLSYTVTIRNNGPDPATNGGLNINLPLAVTHTTDVVPAGWTCFWAGSNGTCSTPSFASGVTAVLTINTTVNSSLAAFPDQSISANFFPSGTTPDPNNANNAKGATTQVDSPQVDLSVTATDSPDPVFPDGNVTYNVTVTNGGPDTASSVNFNVVPNSSLRFVSSTQPAGWSCTLPAVGAVNATFTCSRATWAPGSDNFVVVFSANDEQFGINDTTFQTSFSVNASASNETDNPDNTTTLTTTYTTPDADISVAVVDSPDPVFPDGNITYTVTVTNNGPDAAPSLTLSSFGANNLRFQSATVPAGWNCTLPAAGTQTTSLTCTAPGGAPSGASSVLTFVMQADDALLGINDGTILFGFTATSPISDPNGANNSETESTAYTTPDADIAVSVSDSPDPVFPDGNITYTVTVTNNGPDAAPSLTLSSFGANNLRFQSATVPAGWNCTLPAAGTQTTSLTCTAPGGAPSGASSVLTFVMQADDALLGVNDATILFGFTATSPVSDPNGANNSETESTAYVTPDADISVAVSDSPDPVGPDGNITYTVTVANAGPDTAPSVTLSSFGANNLRFQSATVPAGWNCTLPAAGTQTTSLTCTLPGGMASGGSSLLTFVMQADDALIGNADTTIQFGFTATSPIADPNGANNSETESTLYDVANANLGVTAADAPDPVAAGSNLTYTGTVTNAGPDTATNVTFTFPMSPSLLYVSHTGPAGFTCTTPAAGVNGTITCTIASLPSGASLPYTIVTQVNPALNNGPDGIIEQDIFIGSATNDPTPANNEVTLFTNYTTPDADISVTNSDSPDPVAPGGTIVYTQTITNNGPDTATNVTFTQTTPAGTVLQSFTQPAGWSCTTPPAGGTGTINCTKGTMVATESATFLVAVLVSGGGPISSTVTGDSDTYDPDPLDNSATATTNVAAGSTADLSITKTTPATSAPAGSLITYTIALTNNGPDAATNPVMTDALPSSLLFRSITTPAGFTCTTPAFRTTGTITCNAATLANGATATFTLVTEVAAGSGTVSNTATAGSDTPDGNGGNSGSTSSPVAIGPSSADLTITKTTPTTTATAGTNITYTITVSNAGPSTATNVVVNDTLPAGLQFVSATPSQGTCNAASPVVCNLGNILTGANATITLVAQATGATTSVTNTATATSPDATGPDTATTPAIPVTPGGPSEVAAIPTLSEWMLIVMAGLLGLVALMKSRA